jgi:hypothetical protein
MGRGYEPLSTEDWNKLMRANVVARVIPKGMAVPGLGGQDFNGGATPVPPVSPTPTPTQTSSPTPTPTPTPTPSITPTQTITPTPTLTPTPSPACVCIQYRLSTASNPRTWSYVDCNTGATQVVGLDQPLSVIFVCSRTIPVKIGGLGPGDGITADGDCSDECPG